MSLFDLSPVTWDGTCVLILLHKGFGDTAEDPGCYWRKVIPVICRTHSAAGYGEGMRCKPVILPRNGFMGAGLWLRHDQKQKVWVCCFCSLFFCPIIRYGRHMNLFCRAAYIIRIWDARHDDIHNPAAGGNVQNIRLSVIYPSLPRLLTLKSRNL